MSVNTDRKAFNSSLQRIKTDYPVITFMLSDKSSWDPQTQTIFYNPKQPDPQWSLLHELGHMQAGHMNYSTDVQLLSMELEAWETAKTIAHKYEVDIEQGHIDDCIDSYRDWLHKRSACPKCYQTGAQNNDQTYCCPNCREQWTVSTSRFCRTYRKKQNTP